MPEDQAVPLSKRAALRAVEIAPDFGLAHAQFGFTVGFMGADGAAEHYDQAMALSPGDSGVIRRYA